MNTSVTTKLFAVGALVLALLIPASMISGLVEERVGRRNEAVKDIHRGWSDPQVVRGPFLLTPVVSQPESVALQADLETQTRSRGIYDATVYTAKLKYTARFEEPGEAFIALSDMRGMRETATLTCGGRAREMRPGTISWKSGTLAGFMAPAEKGECVVELSLRGSQSLSVLPVGKRFEAAIRSPWPSPSFTGAFLPDGRTVSGAGFDASWSIPIYARGAELDDSTLFGVNLMTTVDHYTATTRAAKYAVLFIFLTFLSFFFIEFFGEKRLHPMQYLLVGSAIVLFYLLLLSLSEHVGFGAAYALSAAAVVAVVGGYVHGVLGRAGSTAAVVSLTGGLYGYLFILLQLEDYALLLGSLGLLGALAAVMYVTRKLDWYALGDQRA